VLAFLRHRLIVAAALAVAFSFACSDDEKSAFDAQNGGAGGSPPPSGGTGGASGAPSSGGTGMTTGTGGGTAGTTGSSPNDPNACTGPGQCVLVEAARDCCVRWCGSVGISFFTSIHVAHLADWHAGQVCAGCRTPCSDAEQQAFEESARYIVPICQNNRCTPLDIRQHDVTACAADTDCSLRYGSGCCADSSQELIALSDEVAFQALLCANRFTPCGPREFPPQGTSAVCGSNGHCTVMVQSLPPADAGQSLPPADAGQ
jgi:hypothetical protein